MRYPEREQELTSDGQLFRAQQLRPPSAKEMRSLEQKLSSTVQQEEMKLETERLIQKLPTSAAAIKRKYLPVCHKLIGSYHEYHDRENSKTETCGVSNNNNCCY